jgi:hypothetical protein
MQMPNTTPQGIAGLMQKPPGQVPGQQPPMPSPNKASPMAGLGSVDDRVSAYQGNTKPLEQRYAMSQDLLDLLALQKIKSQKDAAARQMQLQMAQQGAQDGQANMTIAQQREQEVDTMTKNELAAQRGDTAQKQAGDQQAMMQKMMGGIAGAPGANTAAQPRAMAAGGIVGYAGPEGSVVGAPEEKNPDMDEEGNPRPKNERERIMAENARMREMKANAQNLGRMREERMSGLQAAQMIPFNAERERNMQEVANQGQNMRPTMANDPRLIGATPPTETAAGPQAAPKPPMPAGPAAPKPPAPTGGLPTLPGAAPADLAAGPQAASDTFGDRIKKASIDAAEVNAEEEGSKREKYVTDKMALPPDQRKVYDEGIAGLQKMYQEQYDPERQRREGIKQFLLGAGGRRYGEFGGGARAAMAYDEKQRANKLKEFGDVQKSRTGLIDIDRANVKGGLDAGDKAREQTSMTKRQGLASAVNVYGTDVDSQDKALGRADRVLDRDIEKLKIKAQADATAATREGTTFSQQQTLLNSTIRNRAQVVENIKKRFASNLNMLEMGLNSTPNDKELLKKRTDLNIKITAEIDKETQPFDNSIARIETAMMGKNSASIGTTEKIK